MLLKNSRYQKPRYFEPQGSQEGFDGIRARRVPHSQGTIEHTLVEHDRLDHLARHYYNDDRLWWRILDANPELGFGDSLSDPGHLGRVILIPPREG